MPITDEDMKKIADEWLRKRDEEIMRATYGSVLMESTAPCDPSVLNQRGEYRWRGSDEVQFLVSSTSSSPQEAINLGFFPLMVSESKQPPKIEDLPPVFRREIDL